MGMSCVCNRVKEGLETVNIYIYIYNMPYIVYICLYTCTYIVNTLVAYTVILLCVGVVKGCGTHFYCPRIVIGYGNEPRYVGSEPGEGLWVGGG